MSYNSQQKLQDNIAAIKIALEFNQRQKLSDAQVLSLKKYSGFGGLKAVLFPDGNIETWKALNASKQDLKLHPQITELHSLLRQHFNKKEYDETVFYIRNSILTAFYTPGIVPQTLFNVLKEKALSRKVFMNPAAVPVYL
jgi:hypothetical protein